MRGEDKTRKGPNLRPANDRARECRGIHVVAKPIGPMCNLQCEYCFYLEKAGIVSRGRAVPDAGPVLSAFIAKYISSQPTPVVEFVWQGGEPTLLGIDFFRRVIELQKPYMGARPSQLSADQRDVAHDEWCRFLKRHNFMVGISLDGPKEVHDRYRRDRKGRGTFEKAMRGLRLLQKHQVEYNVLACVARETAARPLEVYRFLREAGVEFIQFTPIVERMPDSRSRSRACASLFPQRWTDRDEQGEATPWSVGPEAYGDFLIAVFEEWVRHDVGKVFVMNFEWALNAWIGNPSPVCIHAKQCGRSLVDRAQRRCLCLRPLRLPPVPAGQHRFRCPADGWSRNRLDRVSG